MRPANAALALLSALLFAGCGKADAGFDAAGSGRQRPAAAVQATSGVVSRPRNRPPPVCPPEMSLVGAFCIDRYEAHLVRLDRPEEPLSPFERPIEGIRYAARSAAGVVPQGYISRIEAADACHNAGKRLCGAREWHQACGGSQGTRYPYGPKELPGRCNTGKKHLPSLLFGTRAAANSARNYNSPRLNQEPGYLAKTAEYAGCVNDYGLFDMVGNLHEWVADESNSVLYKKIPIPYGQQNLGPRGSGVFMGGFFSSTSRLGHGCNYVTTHHAPSYHDYSTGFRCCSEPIRQD
ncbi:MAG: SUMF1/EgtB/PvdO family nonheme iron enzyme [Polyangiaceae bacterium]|nr:SUMF1/EgtB/PvdO family nonheme iron enzyme [Polyangiaceae bacterium]